MAKKMKKRDHTGDAKAVVSLFIVLVAFSIFLLFYTNKESIFSSGNFKSMMVLTIIGMGFLVGLLYLVNTSRSSKRRK